MTKEISLLVFIEVKEDHRQQQIDAYNTLAPIVRKEKGCLQYDLKEVQGKENEFVLVERWASAEALSAHDVTPHMIEADKLSPIFRAKSATVIKLTDIVSV